MPKLTAIKIPRVDGSKIIAGYKISLTKSACERNNFHEGDDIEVVYKKNEIKLKRRESKK